MTASQFQRLVENIRTDGQPTALPLVYQPPGQDYEEILSGHHRTAACIEVGLAEIDYLCITSVLTEERKRAIQLSHNSITGQDDTSILKDLYDSLDLEAKKFSGLTDDTFKGLDAVSVAGLSIGSVKYESLVFAFLPDDHKAAVEGLEAIRKANGKVEIEMAAREDFDAFFDAIIQTKRVTGVHNSATAVSMMIALAVERLEQLQAEKAEADDTAPAAA